MFGLLQAVHNNHKLVHAQWLGLYGLAICTTWQA